MSVWELRELRRKLHENGQSHVDEASIFEAYSRLREREARTTMETKRARHMRVRRQALVVPLPSDERAVESEHRRVRPLVGAR